MAMTLVSTITASTTVLEMTFNNVPQTGKDLLLVVSHRHPDNGITGLFLRFNANTSNYSYRELIGNGSTVSSVNASAQDSIRFGYAAGGTSATTNTFGNSAVYIANYTVSAAKSVSSDSVFENNATRADQNITAGLWNNTAAITSVTINTAMVANSTASLYIIS